MTEQPQHHLTLYDGRVYDLNAGVLVDDGPTPANPSAASPTSACGEGESHGEAPPTPEGYTRVPTSIEAQNIVARARRTAEDLPAPPGAMNGVSLVLTYTLFGLDDLSIAIVTDLSVDAIKRIRASAVYTEMYAAVSEGMQASETNQVRDILAQAAQGAANRIVDQVNSTNADVSFRAAKDILDRSGNRPVDTVVHKHEVDGEMRIRYIEPENDLPTIDATVIEVDDG